MKRYMTAVVVLGLILIIFPSTLCALETEFSGRVQSTFVLRDTNGGFQRGFYDSSAGVQWRNELKFDLYLRPSSDVGLGEVKFEKVFLSYRGAYDAIFECRRDEYSDIREKSPADYEYGKDDIEWENDLREAFIDFVADVGPTTTTLRLGRQIVQWGEADGFNMINQVCPNDLSFQMFFSNPEDTITPIWMLRLNHEVRDVGPLRTIGLEFVATTDIQPTQFAPLGNYDNTRVNFDAPYAFLFSDFRDLEAGLGTPVRAIKEDVAANSLDNMEYGFRLNCNFPVFGSDFSGSLYYLVHHQDDPAADLSSYFDYVFSGGAAGEDVIYFRHPRLRSYGLSFNTYSATIDTIIKGEAAFHDSLWLTNNEETPPSGNGTAISRHEVYEAMIGFDKSFKQLYWTGTISNWDVGVQAYWRHTSGWSDEYDDVFRGRLNRGMDREDRFLYSLSVRTDYYHGTFFPSLFAFYDPQGTWNLRPSLQYQPSHKWFVEVIMMTFLGKHAPFNAFPHYMIENGSETSFRVGYRF